MRSIRVPGFKQQEFLIVKISEGSWFGDFSCLTETESMFNVIADSNTRG